MDSDPLTHEIIDCERCPRLREHCVTVAREKRKAYLDWDYWGRPVRDAQDRALAAPDSLGAINTWAVLGLKAAPAFRGWNTGKRLLPSVVMAR